MAGPPPARKLDAALDVWAIDLPQLIQELGRSHRRIDDRIDQQSLERNLLRTVHRCLDGEGVQPKNFALAFVCLSRAGRALVALCHSFIPSAPYYANGKGRAAAGKISIVVDGAAHHTSPALTGQRRPLDEAHSFARTTTTGHGA